MTDLIREMRPPVAVPRYLLHGLSLSGTVLNALRNRGIHCQPEVSLEHQHRAGRYVLRGVASGGAVSDMGRACMFVSPEGMPLPWLQKIDSFAVNGRHAIFLAESLVRIDMLRVGRTCDVVITAHTLSHSPGRHRPEIHSTLLFRGRDGVLPAELWRPEHRAMGGQVVPVFYNRAGEVSDPLEAFQDAMKRASACVCCIGCRHSHAGIPLVHQVQTFARRDPACSSSSWCQIDVMPSTNPISITVGEPNWAPLETVLMRCECGDFMYMGRVGQIELYKHVFTRRYLNISHDGRRFYRRERDEYIEISKTEALDYARH